MAKEVFPVGCWRCAPACCAAQSVIRRGPCCSVPLHRLAWAAQHALPERNPTSKRSGNHNLNGSCLTRIWPQVACAVRPHTKRSENSNSNANGLFPTHIYPQPACAVWPNPSLNRTHCSVPPFGLKKPSPNASPPQWAG